MRRQGEDRSQLAVYQYCPNCGSQIKQEAAFCWSCGMRLGDPSNEAEKKPVPAVRWKRILAAGAAFMIFATGAGLFGWLGSSRFMKKIDAKPAEQTELFYVKDNSLYGFKTKNKKKEPVLYTDEFIHAPVNDLAVYMNEILSRRAFPLLVSKDRKYHFIIEDVKGDISSYTESDGTHYSRIEDITCTLSVKKGNQDPVKIDKNVEINSVVTEENKVFYQKKGDLYVYDLKDKKKIDSDVIAYNVDCGGQHVMWWSKADFDTNDQDTEQYTDLYDIYYQDIEQKTEKIKIEQGVVLYGYSDDFNQLLLRKGDSYYWVENQTEKEKIGNNILNVYQLDLENKSCFFAAKMQKSLSDMVEDDMIELDSAMKEPVISEYMKENHSVNDENYFDFIDESYYEDMKKYEEKLARDRLRKSLAENDFSYVALYYYENGTKILTAEVPFPVWLWVYCDTVTSSYSQKFQSVLGYFNVKEHKIDELKVPLSDVNNVDEVYQLLENRISEMKKLKHEFCMYFHGKEFKLDVDGFDVHEVVADMEIHKAYMTLNDTIEPQNSNLLISISLEEDSFGDVEEIDKEVERIVSGVGNHIYYMKDLDKNLVGDLYCNGKFLLSDSYWFGYEADESVFFLEDYDGKKKTGTLVKITGEETEILEEDVRYFCPFSENSVMMITDYNEKKNKGDLMYYNGKETYLIDRDVSGYLNTYVRQ